MHTHLLRFQELNCCTFLGCRVIDLDTDLCTRFLNSLGQINSQRGTQTGVSFSDIKLQICQSTATVALGSQALPLYSRHLRSQT